MNRFCPNCHGANVRRSSTPAANVTWRNNFLSRYRCRECLTQFWVISRKTYTAVATFAGAIVLVVIGVFVMEMVFTRSSAPPPAPARKRAESAPVQRASVAPQRTSIARVSERA